MLTVDGIHVPTMLLVEVVGKTGATSPEHIGGIAKNVVVVLGKTIVVISTAVVAHCPGAGVKV